MIFKYSGIDEFGKKVSDKIEASDLAEAKSKLKPKRLFIKKSVKKPRHFLTPYIFQENTE
ncbi:hypothetical protein [Sulfurimonas sp. NW9]|uniref:hypothetical protein n=1 Tax=Sulfurimonas sp. NW9 TaxID=2922728 RepID=UPI003DA925CF